MGGEVGIISKLIFCIYFAINSGVIGENLSENNVSNPQEEGKLIAKRYDLDFQTCIENFDIHKDKIIRTQDSRAMGAKYINEIDNPGSCYLFHCGTPDDFKCKFTKHHNYTSAVLAINRHMTELENQIKLTKHEEELTRLRKPETVAEQSTIQPYAATSLVPPGPSAKESAPLSPASSSNATAGMLFLFN
ncbi:hypothetical protein C0J52_04999 [Blattella germanica]|nr:hypothetical protein C0J52_04999 [Blattella germanica]